jgi:hypothetical protein
MTSFSPSTRTAAATPSTASALAMTCSTIHSGRLTVRKLIWEFYADLNAWRRTPTPEGKVALQARFDNIFTHKTGFVTLDCLLARLHANKSELLMVLDRPEIPLHTNGSENDLRCHVTSGHAAISVATAATPSSASTRPAPSSKSHSGTIGNRLAVPAAKAIPRLPEIILARSQAT